MEQLQTELYRSYGKKATLKGQTAVECRFGGEVDTVLAVHATASLLRIEADNGEVRYAGRAHFFIVYEDGDRHVCRAEKGVEFATRIQDETCVPALTPRLKFITETVTTRREGASVYATALFTADVTLFGEQSFCYLTDGPLVVKRENLKLSTAHLCSGDTELSDEFGTDFVGDILLHTESVGIIDVSCATGVLKVNGEINVCILALKGEEPVSLERLIPFSVELPCDEAGANSTGEAFVSVKSISIGVDADEEQGKSELKVELTLSIDGCVYAEETIDGITDAFSTENALSLSYSELSSTASLPPVRLTERISGKAALSGTVDFSDVFLAVVSERAEASVTVTPDGKRLEGIASATLLVKSADKTHRSVELSLPFSVAVNAESNCDCNVLVCGMSARQRQEGEIEVEGTLKITLFPYRTSTVKAVSSAEEGAPVKQSDSAVSVYIPRAGDGLWELSKSLKKPPEEVLAGNPDLEFPIQEGQRVVIFRKKTLPMGE